MKKTQSFTLLIFALTLSTSKALQVMVEAKECDQNSKKEDIKHCKNSFSKAIVKMDYAMATDFKTKPTTEATEELIKSVSICRTLSKKSELSKDCESSYQALSSNSRLLAKEIERIDPKQYKKSIVANILFIESEIRIFVKNCLSDKFQI